MEEEKIRTKVLKKKVASFKGTSEKKKKKGEHLIKKFHIWQHKTEKEFIQTARANWPRKFIEFSSNWIILQKPRFFNKHKFSRLMRRCNNNRPAREKSPVTIDCVLIHQNRIFLLWCSIEVFHTRVRSHSPQNTHPHAYPTLLNPYATHVWVDSKVHCEARSRSLEIDAV